MPNPTVVYNNGGVFSVQLIVGNAAGSNTASLNQLIQVGTAPVVLFSYDFNGLSVGFTNATDGATSYSWNFGDGNSSTAANPSHTYAAPGEYQVSLEASNECGLSVLTQTLFLGVDGTEFLKENEYQLLASPNPFTDKFSVSYELATQFSEANLLIFNAYGQQIANSPLTASTGKFELGAQLNSSGVYFIRLQLDGRMGQAVRVVKL